MSLDQHYCDIAIIGGVGVGRDNSSHVRLVRAGQ